MKKSYFTPARLAVLGMLGAITIILGLTPLGFLPVPPLGATLVHLPTVIAGIVGGPVMGGIMGLLFGLTSVYSAITQPTGLAPLFFNPLVSVLPRILVGLVSAWVFRGFSALLRVQSGKMKKSIAIGGAALIGSLTNTVLVLGMIFLLYAGRYAETLGISQSAVLGSLGGIAALQGIPEALLAAAVAIPVVLALGAMRLNLFRKEKSF